MSALSEESAQSLMTFSQHAERVACRVSRRLPYIRRHWIDSVPIRHVAGTRVLRGASARPSAIPASDLVSGAACEATRQERYRDVIGRLLTNARR